ETTLAEIDKLGKLLFYDPILSGNNSRSCISCHQSTAFFTDTATATSLQYNQSDRLDRNTPSLLNVPYNHLLMLDGKHISMKDQAVAVITNSKEMGADAAEVLKKILSCKEYRNAFIKLLKYTPQEKEITMEHITSALSFYYSKFSKYDAAFDEAMNTEKELDPKAKKGFNIFMSKAQCATCHFVPQFNGVKPPYVGSEFEVLGVPEDTTYKALSKDKGRYEVNAAQETAHAFRTGTLRNAEHTKPYMHNGVFNTLDQVIDFYNTGGGSGKGLLVENQTLSADSLHLTNDEKKQLIAFIKSLSERIHFELAPEQLPASSIAILNKRKVGGSY
ncbi:MAG TPA: cytochrome c peroxidase, partial [Bacteroidia bacterium]|nr:cytochrome c peroxidase [Bacteroidia bacterium]